MLDTRPRTVKGIGASIVSKLIARQRPRGYPIWGTAVVDVLVAGPRLPQNKRHNRIPSVLDEFVSLLGSLCRSSGMVFLSAGIGTRLVIIQQCSCRSAATLSIRPRDLDNRSLASVKSVTASRYAMHSLLAFRSTS